MHDLTISVADILGRPGEYREHAIGHPLEGVSVALARLTDEPVAGTLRAESVVEGILITGGVGTAITCECARCLNTFAGEIDVDLCELFVAPGHEVPEGEDAYRFHGQEIDLEPMLRDAVTLALPLKPLCREDCKGLCATCGKDLNSETCECIQDDTDPRWAALSALRDQLSG